MLLLQTIVDGQRKNEQKLDDALERMATKEDIRMLMAAQDKFALKSELEDVKKDVRELMASRLPKWTWSAVTVVAMVAVALIGHFWK